MNTTTEQPTTYGIVGSGWRAEFFLRIARVLPERFRVSGLVTRNEERAHTLEAEFGIRTFRSVERLIEETASDFIVVSVAKSAAFEVVASLVDREIAVLCETPPASELDELTALAERVRTGARIQVAEQFHLQPMHAAGIAVCRSGLLGEISHAQVSVNHNYHGISLMRRYLGIGFENATINAFEFVTPGVAGPGRSGLGETETMRNARHVVALFDFDGRSGMYDYEQDQHRSWIRSRRVLVRGTRGELHDQNIRYLEDFKTPIVTELRRMSAGEDGNLEGYGLKGILAGEKWIYRNPYFPAPLVDEEVAVAGCVEKMAEYLQSGKGFYGLADAAQDAYLALEMERSIESHEAVRTETQAWAG